MLKKFRIIKRQLKKLLKLFYEQHFEKIIEINEKYASPRIATVPIVKFALAALKIYLLFIVGLLLYKFITLVY
ncbi:MAG: hypothetical protein A2039_10135 [Candidatus Melainabacteria bacterium GWA2_34_9]|nr:MAG: hypothetical protein A2039_10135 [Candidatus Melainabacteria bacterium GWA2_34_9]